MEKLRFTDQFRSGALIFRVPFSDAEKHRAGGAAGLSLHGTGKGAFALPCFLAGSFPYGQVIGGSGRLICGIL